MKDVLADQLLANANDPSWYIPFSDAVKGLSEREAFWKPNEESNSIAEIVQHLLYWNSTWQTRYKESNVNAVPAIEIITKVLCFQIIKLSMNYGKTTKKLLQWKNLINEEKVESDVVGFPVSAKWWEVLANVTTHNAYHIGQIIYIRKLQQSFDNE